MIRSLVPGGGANPAGPRPRRLRRRLHITMRDLMSVLAFVVAGNRRCGDIVDLYEAPS